MGRRLQPRIALGMPWEGCSLVESVGNAMEGCCDPGESTRDGVPCVTLHQDSSPVLGRSFLQGRELEEKSKTKTKSKENQTVHSPGFGDYGYFF